MREQKKYNKIKDKIKNDTDNIIKKRRKKIRNNYTYCVNNISINNSFILSVLYR